MKTYRRLLFLLCHLGLIPRTEAQLPTQCTGSGTNRPTEKSEITVICGTEYIDLGILLCPLYQASYNESMIVLNNQHTTPECFGTAYWTVHPPVLKFRFPLDEKGISSCKNTFKTTTQVGDGHFADISKVQFVNISGTLNSVDPSSGRITYLEPLLYKFTCFYPLQYLVNNTRLRVSGVNLAVSHSNGSFISTLNMHLYSNLNQTQRLIVPYAGLSLRTKIYVAVTATKLTDRFNVLLDRCYTSLSPNPQTPPFYDLFVGCTRDRRTRLRLNGKSQVASFSFETFRFVEDKDKVISTYYLHCITRLCEVSSCSALLPHCPKRVVRREAKYVSESATVSSPAIVVAAPTTDETTKPSVTTTPSLTQTKKDKNYDSLSAYPSRHSVLSAGASSLNHSGVFVEAIFLCNVIYILFYI